MNLYKQVNEWLLKYEPLNNWIYFNATPYISGVAALNSVPTDRVKRTFINGNKEKELIFAIDMVTDYDGTGTSTINLDAIDEVSHFCDWLDEQDKVKNYPDFGEKNTIKKVEVLNNVPSVLVNNEQQLAKYQFQVRIDYLCIDN